MRADLNQLIELQKTDTGIRHLQAELERIPQRRAEIESEFDQRAFEFRQLERRRDDATVARADFENQITTLRQQVERAERNLMQSKNQKDYEAAIREADAARRLISQLETKILEQMEIAEGAESEIGQREPEVSKLRDEIKEKIAQYETEAQHKTAQLEELKREREQLVARMPKQLLSLYNRISTRIPGGIAVVEARNYTCTACLMTLRPQVMAEVRRGDDVVMCESCSRILYVAETTEKAPALSMP